jgi:hypothetical protein
MRRERPGDFSVTLREIEEVRSRDALFAQQILTLKELLNEALSRDASRFSESEVVELREEIAGIEARRNLAADRIAALQSRLPSPEQRNEASTTAQKLLSQFEDAQSRYTTAWENLIREIRRTEQFAAAVRSCRTTLRRSFDALTDHTATFGLSIDIPHAVGVPDTAEAKEVEFLGLVIAHAARGTSGDGVERELVAMRATSSSGSART